MARGVAGGFLRRLDKRPRVVASSLLADRRALVTGGASGIGRALADALRKAGADVEVADVRAQPACDVTRGADVDALFARLHAAGRLPDLLVLGAGIGAHERLAEGDPDLWARVMDVNVVGAMRTLRAFVPPMLARGSGDVVFLSSVSARHPYPYGAAYAASKAALDVVAETLRLETQPALRVLVARLGIVDTPFFERASGHPGDVRSLGWGALSPEQAAEAILDALSRPHEVAINELVLRPVGQPM